MRNLREMAEVAASVGSLVHEVQLERGLSAAFLGSGGTQFAQNQASRHARTDQLAALQRRCNTWRRNILMIACASRIVDAQVQWMSFAAWRREAAAGDVTPEVQLARYSAGIHALIGIVQEMYFLGSDADISRSIYALVNLMQAKEAAGVERALGVTYFSAPRVDAIDRQVFVAQADRQANFLEQFRFFAALEQVQQLDRVLADEKAAEIERLRGFVFQRVLARQEATQNTTARWIDVMTWKIDQIRLVEDRTAQALIAQAQRAEDAARKSVLWSGAAALAGLLLAVLIAGALARGIIFPIERITRAMNRLATQNAGDTEVEIIDHQRGDEIGEMARATLVFRDNLVRIAQAEERLKSAVILRLHHKALSAISQGVLIVDAQGLVTFANAALAAITGYAPEDFVGRPPGFLCAQAQDNAGLEARDGMPCMLEGRRRDGQPFWFEAMVSPVLDSEGVATHSVVVLRDITESRRIEEMRIAATASESLHGMIVTDARGNILRVNRAFTRMTGYEANEVIGRTPAMFKSGRHDAAFYVQMWKSLADRGAWFE